MTSRTGKKRTGESVCDKVVGVEVLKESGVGRDRSRSRVFSDKSSRHTANQSLKVLCEERRGWTRENALSWLAANDPRIVESLNELVTELIMSLRSHTVVDVDVKARS